MRKWNNGSEPCRATIGAALLAAALAVPSEAAAEGARDSARTAGVGLATVLANAVYMPVKLAYAGVGGVTGGLAYVVTGGNKAVAERIIEPSLGGDYVITPSHVTGRQPIEFSGDANQEARGYAEGPGVADDYVMPADEPQ